MRVSVDSAGLSVGGNDAGTRLEAFRSTGDVELCGTPMLGRLGSVGDGEVDGLATVFGAVIVVGNPSGSGGPKGLADGAKPGGAK